MEIQKLRCHFFDTLWNMSQRKAAAAAASAAASTYVTDTVGIHRHRFAAGGGNEHMYAPSLARHHADLRYGGLGIGGPCQKSKLILCLKKGYKNYKFRISIVFHIDIHVKYRVV